MCQVVLAQGICPLEGLPTPVAQKRARSSVHICTVPYQVLLAVCLVAALGALVQGCAALECSAVTCMTLAVPGKQQGSGGAIAAVGAFHRLRWCPSGTLTAVVSHSVVAQEQLLVIRRVATVGAAMKVVAVR